MNLYLNEKCEECGHLGVDHEVRNNSMPERLNAICWECANSVPVFDEDQNINLDAYHIFKFDNLDYLQRVYEDKYKIK